MTYDSKRDRLLLFGGRKNKRAEGDLNDFWEYDLKMNTWHQADYMIAKEPNVAGPKQVNSILNFWKK